MAIVRFKRDFGEIEVSAGTTLLACAARASAPLGNACRGRGVCRACAVWVVAGHEALSPVDRLEERFGLEPGWRMACRTRVLDPKASVDLWSPHWGGECACMPLHS